MKRYWTTDEFVLRQKRRIRKSERLKQKRRKQYRRPRKESPKPRATRSGLEEQTLVAPEVLNLFVEPNETLNYCNTLRYHLNKREIKVDLDLRNIRSFSSDALLLMRAIILNSRSPTRSVGGNLPVDPKVASEFKASGFFQGFDQPPADLPPAKGLMLDKSNFRVYAKTASELVDFAENHVAITRECTNACFQTLVEVMTNTHNHAGDKKPGMREEKWFVSVYCIEGLAYFNFVDLGIGILKSAQAINFLKRFGSSLFAFGRISLLKEAFNGTIGSVTGNPGRGLGLPRMKWDAENDKLSDLQVLTSNVIGSVADLDFKSIHPSLHGTLFRWCAGPKGV